MAVVELTDANFQAEVLDAQGVVLVDVWATWCGPCVSEFSELVDTYRMYMGRDFEMYTISTDKLEKKDKVISVKKNKNIESS